MKEKEFEIQAEAYMEDIRKAMLNIKELCVKEAKRILLEKGEYDNVLKTNTIFVYNGDNDYINRLDEPESNETVYVNRVRYKREEDRIIIECLLMTDNYYKYDSWLDFAHMKAENKIQIVKMISKDNPGEE